MDALSTLRGSLKQATCRAKLADFRLASPAPPRQKNVTRHEIGPFGAASRRPVPTFCRVPAPRANLLARAAFAGRRLPSGGSRSLLTLHPATPASVSRVSAVTPRNRKGDPMHILWALIIGLIVGAIAKLLMPGKDPGGVVITMLLGVAGSLVAGFLGRAFGWYHSGHEWSGNHRFDHRRDGPAVHLPPGAGPQTHRLERERSGRGGWISGAASGTPPQA